MIAVGGFANLGVPRLDAALHQSRFSIFAIGVGNRRDNPHSVGFVTTMRFCQS